MTVAEIEQNIIIHLKTALPALDINVAVEPFPEKPSEYRLSHPIGAVLVRYNGTSFNKPVGKHQITRYDFEFILLSRSLRDHQGAYMLLDAVRKIMTSYSQPEYSKFEQTDEDFFQERNGIWEYGQKYSTNSVYVLGT